MINNNRFLDVFYDKNKFQANPLLLAGLVRFVSRVKPSHHIPKVPFATHKTQKSLNKKAS